MVLGCVGLGCDFFDEVWSEKDSCDDGCYGCDDEGELECVVEVGLFLLLGDVLGCPDVTACDVIFVCHGVCWLVWAVLWWSRGSSPCGAVKCMSVKAMIAVMVMMPKISTMKAMF